MAKRYELVIIGGGSAAFGAAMKAEELGARALLVERGTIGGTCVNNGCLPTKHLLHVGELVHLANNHGFRGVESTATLDFRTVMEEKDRLVQRMRKAKYQDVLGGLKNVDFLQGEARFVSGNEIEVGGETYAAERFVIATGSSPVIPPIPGIRDVDYLANVEALELRERPESMIVLGGGALGVEFAQMFSRFGVKVCLLQRGERLVPREEPELAKLLEGYLREEGIEVCTGVDVTGVREEDGLKVVEAEVRGERRSYRAEALLVATGRRPNTAGMGLEKVGVKLDERSGAVLVDKEMRTSAPHVWAAGDVTGEPMLETVAAKGGSIAAHNALSGEKKRMDYTVVPHAVFTSPQLAGVGLTDVEAIQKGIRCRCMTVGFDAVPKAVAVKETKGAIKMVVEDGTKRIIGVHILSSMAADIVHEGAVIVRDGLTISDVIDVLHIFPTLSEAIKIAAQSFLRDVERMPCCIE